GISPAATIDRGAMTSLGSNQWQASIPVPVGGWSSQGLRTLQYYASPLTDIRGNGGASATVNDLVDLSGATPVYVSSQSVVAPTPPLANPTNLGADDGALAVLSEGATTATAVLATNNQVSASGWSSTGSNPEDATTSNNGYRTNSASPPNPLRLGFPNPSPGGTITQVNVKVEQSITSFVDNAWAVRACVAGGGCGTTSATQLGTSSGSTDVTRTFDVTTLHPTGASSWTWTDVNNLEVEVLVGFGANGNRDGSTARVDYVTVEVVHATYTGTLQLDWTGVPVSSTYFLDLEYTASADETFNVNVWDWTTSSYATRGTLTATSPTPFAYLLTANEVQGGAVRVRLVDVNAADTVLSTVSLDYARLDLV
ncbi:MAG TPA: hypothetical protein VI796_01265, partial [Candidatus Thermoplasmatota archaeon]|nr:hypothetical protein [Candidatus Thermoplasmatota archaeon]